MDLSDAEIRVLGCLLEKQRTVPDQYPLSLNSLRLACNQSTNREPVLDYDEAIIRDALHRLERRGYARLASGRGSRAAKFRHLLSEALPMSEAEQAIVCVLMLRGAQTPGELKQRGERIHRFAGLEEVHETLERLIDRGLLRRLERRPGQKEERYEQLLGEDHEDREGAGRASERWEQRPGERRSGEQRPGEQRPGERRPGEQVTPGQAPPTQPIPAQPAGEPGLRERVERLEQEVAELRAAVAELTPNPPTMPAQAPSEAPTAPTSEPSTVPQPTALPSTAEPSTAEPSTAEPSTAEPSTALPSTASQPTVSTPFSP